jgi:hypothetical protein
MSDPTFLLRSFGVGLWVRLVGVIGRVLLDIAALLRRSIAEKPALMTCEGG